MRSLSQFLRSVVPPVFSAKRSNRRRQRAMQAEQLESRIVLSAILLDFPGINGDADAVGGATSRDMELDNFEWGFSRTTLNDPIEFNDLTFERTIDSASNDLYAQSALQTLSTTPARLRLLDGGVNKLKFDLSNARLTEFATENDGTESGAISFSNLGFTESFTATQRTASWNLLNGDVSSSTIAGPGNIDPTPNSLNIQTVLHFGTDEKILIDGFSWKAYLDVDMSLANPLSGLAVGSNFKITRGVDAATAGILGSAAAGATFPEIKITDRDLIVGKNRVTMEWKLTDAFFASFELQANNTDAPINKLELSYGKIELKVHQFNPTTGALTNTETTLWDKAGNIVTATTDFGIANPALVDNPSNPGLNPVISSLNFGTPAGSTTALGKLAYGEIDWSVEKGVTIGEGTDPNTFTPTQLGAMTVTLPAAQNSPAPALLGQLAKRSVISSVNAFEKNTSAPTSALDQFTLSNVIVTSFSVNSTGLSVPEIEFGLDFRSFSEAFTDRTVPATPVVTAANFNVQTQASTGVLSFGGKTIDTNFELVITEAGATSEIPVQNAGWSVSRELSRSLTGDIDQSAPTQSTFGVDVKRGVHSPGLLAAAVRGTEIDSVSVRRFEVVEVNGNTIKKELYRWDLTSVFITGAGIHMLPGNSLDEVDRISFLPTEVKLSTPGRTPTPGHPSTSFTADWNFATVTGGGGGDSLNAAQDRAVLQFKVEGVFNADRIAIDSYQWGASLPVDNATSSGIRPLGNPDAGSLLLKTSRIPSPTLLAEALKAGGRVQRLTLPPGATELGQRPYQLALTTAFVNGYSYRDEIGLDKPETGFSVFVGESAQLDFTPLNTDGTAGTKRSVNWNLVNDTTTLFNGFGGFQFPVDQNPEITVELFGSQLAADGYTFGIDNEINQLVGKSTAVVPLAARGNPAARTFNISTTLDATTPGLLNAIATKTLIPEIKITERRMVSGTGGSQFLPYREWVLTNVLVESLANKATAGGPYGGLELQLNAASAKATYITYNAAFTATSTSKRLNFADLPAIAPLPVTAIATDADRLIDLPSRFTDPQLNYALTVVSGANLFDGVSVNAQNRLVLNFKPGQAGNAQIRINGTNAFGLTSSLLVNVAVDDGISQAPAGTDKTATFNEDTTYFIRTSDFGFTDPSDFPANTFAAVKIASLPATGSLKLNGVAVAAGQTIPVADLNSNQLRYTPVPNGQGTNLASFTFQVQDNGGGAANLDLSPNVFTFTVANVNDAPTLSSDDIAAAPINEDTTNSTGTLVSELLSGMNDVDPGALKGMAVYSVAPNGRGVWQFTLDNGTNWTPCGSATVSAARLLPSDANTRVRFIPNANVSGSDLLAFYAWDQTSGTAGQTANVGVRGGLTAFSPTRQRVIQTVNAVNDAPVMTSVAPVLPQIDEDPVFTPGPTSGVPVSALIGGITDIDTNAQKGIAVFEASTTGGRWQYSVTNGETWFNFNTVSLASARLLRNSSSNRVRFLPNANANGQATLKFHAWDITQGNNGGLFDLSVPNSTGGTTGFSTAFETVTQTIRAINDAPTITAPVSQNAVMNTPLVFSTANENRLFIGDVDASNQPVQMTMTATNGTFTLPSTVQLTFVSGGNGQSSFTVSGRVGMINEALAGAFYTPNFGSFGNSSLTISVNDQGNTGVGGSLTATTTVALSVALPSNTVALGGLSATTPTIRRSGNRDGTSATPDFYTFTIAAASDVRVNLSGLSADVDVRVFSSGGQMVGQSLFFSTTVENILMTALPAGTYLVDLRGQVVSAYDLTLSTAPTSDDLITQAITLSSPTAATLPTVRHEATSTTADLQDYFKFNLTAASALRINLSGLSQNVDFELLDSAGRVIQSASAIDNEIVNMLTSSLAIGLYHVRVFAFGELMASKYDLTISTNTTSDDLLTNATSLGLLGLKGSDRRTGNVATGTDIQDYYAFAGSGDVAISLSGLSSDVDVQVLDRFGRVLASSTNGGNNFESINLNIAPGSGTIFIRVFAFSGSSNYVLEARNNSNAANADDLLSTATVLPNPITSLSRTGAVGGTGSTGDPQDYYRFELSTVRNVTVILTGLSADLDIEVLDQFGNLLFFSRNGGSSSETINMANLGIGTYFIRIHPFGSAISNYTLGLTV